MTTGAGSADPAPASSTGRLERAIPAPLMALAAMSLVQTGAAVSVPLFDHLGVLGTTWGRLVIAAAVMLALTRPRLADLGRTQMVAALSLGIAMAVMTLCYFQAVARAPLGIVTTIEFLGPLGVAVIGSRRLSHIGLALLAGAGVVLLAGGEGGGAIDRTGIAFALVAALGWAGYILLSQRVGRAFTGLQGLALSLAVAALVSTPFGAPEALPHLSAETLVALIGVALLVPLIPYALEMMALRRMPARSFGVLMSLEPGIGAAAGFVVLGQALSLAQLAGIALVMAASIGAVATGSRA